MVTSNSPAPPYVGLSMQARKPSVWGRTRPRWTGLSATDILFATSIILFPANAVISVDQLGEVSSEPYVLINLFLMPFALSSLIFRGLITRSNFLIWFGGALCVAIVVSICSNLDNILIAELKDRSGLARAFLGTLVLGFGFYFSHLVFWQASSSFRRNIAVPLLLGAILVSAVGTIELLSWVSSGIYDRYLDASEVMHRLTRRGEFIVGRISSITAEASNFGMYTTLAIPWMWALGHYFRRPMVRALCFLVGLDLAVLALFSGRTSIIGFAAIVLVLLWMRLMFATCSREMLAIMKFGLMAGFVVFSVVPLFIIIIFQNDIAQFVTSSDSVSNVSRFGTMAI